MKTLTREQLEDKISEQFIKETGMEVIQVTHHLPHVDKCIIEGAKESFTCSVTALGTIKKGSLAYITG